MEITEEDRIKELKNKLDQKEITTEELSLEDLEKINTLYEEEIENIQKRIEKLGEENSQLKKILKKE